LCPPCRVRSALCGHRVVCDPCGSMLLRHTRKCPVCRAEFLPEMEREGSLPSEGGSPSAAEAKHSE